MISQKDVDILDFDVISQMVGGYLNIESLIQEVVRFLKKRIPAKNVRVFIFDSDKKRFFKESGSRRIYLNSKAKAHIFLKSLKDNEAFFKDRLIVIPLRAKDRFIGCVVFESLTFSLHPIRYKEEITRWTRMVGVVLANAQFFIDYERLNKDMFKFSVLSRALNPAVEEEEAMRIFCEGVSKIINFDIFALLVLGKQGKKMYVNSKFPLTAANTRYIKQNIFNLIKNLTLNRFKDEDIKTIIDCKENKTGYQRINSYITVPLVIKERILGVVSLNSFNKENFSARDHRNVSMLASQGAMVLENTMLYKDLRRTYLSIVRALTSAIEAKDPYTQGHSILVAKYAEAIAQEMGLSPIEIESIQIAGLLHDLGKIGVPEEILLKMGKLTPGEYEVVKSHPEIALRILGAVEFPQFFKTVGRYEIPPELTLKLFEPADLSEDVKLIIYHHHERYAGGGYPKGIKGEVIPLGARIMAVADTFEAITANRPYRKAYSLREAEKILFKAGKDQLDLKIVKVFLKVLKKKGFKTLREEAMVLV